MEKTNGDPFWKSSSDENGIAEAFVGSPSSEAKGLLSTIYGGLVEKWPSGW